jgi:hypothetical protein
MLAGQGGNACTASDIKDFVLSGNMDESACEIGAIKVTVSKKINFSLLAIEYPFLADTTPIKNACSIQL